MKKMTVLTMAIGLGFACIPEAQAWTNYLDGSSLPVPGAPWVSFSNEGSTALVDLGGGNSGLRMNSLAHGGGPGTFYNEYYVGPNGGEQLGAARFRVESFSATGKENLLSVSALGTPFISPSITLVDGRYKVWNYISLDTEIFDLGPAVAGEFHEAYILARLDGTAQVWWDGAFVFDGAVPGTIDGGYVEFGSGTYWQTTAATVVDFDWVGWGGATDMPPVPEPGSLLLLATGLLGLAGWVRFRK